ncbi:MAG: hypothetical protein KAT00_01450 [Planctomycetes bacterium]|nr:hypothetical protein [Planctomycetota bacterium]
MTHTAFSLEVPRELGTWDEFTAFGCQLVNLRRVTLIALGDLALAGLDRFADEDTTKTAWAKTCAGAWGCGRVTVLRAMALASSGVEFPPDMFPSKAYRLYCLTDDDSKLALLVDRATMQGWRNSDIDELVHLHSLDLIGPPETWHKPHFEIVDETKLVIHLDGRSTTVAWLEDAGDSNLTDIGIKLLKMRGGIK